MIPCAYKNLFGFDCALCGGQRSFIELLKGNFSQSFLIYPPLVFVLALILLFATFLVKRQWVPVRALKTYAMTVLIIVMVNYAVKLIFGPAVA